MKKRKEENTVHKDTHVRQDLTCNLRATHTDASAHADPVPRNAEHPRRTLPRDDFDDSPDIHGWNLNPRCPGEEERCPAREEGQGAAGRGLRCGY